MGEFQMILKNRDTMLHVIISFLFLVTLLPIVLVGLHARPHLDDLPLPPLLLLRQAGMLHRILRAVFASPFYVATLSM